MKKNLILIGLLSLLVACGLERGGADSSKQTSTFGAPLKTVTLLTQAQKNDLKKICDALTVRGQELPSEVGDVVSFKMTATACDSGPIISDVEATITLEGTGSYKHEPREYQSRFIKDIPTNTYSYFKSVCEKDNSGEYLSPALITANSSLKVAVEIAQNTASTKKNLTLKYFALDKLSGKFLLKTIEGYVFETSTSNDALTGVVYDLRRETQCKSDASKKDLVVQTLGL